MTNETAKALLMILLFGGLEAAIRVAKTKSRHRTLPDRAAAWVRSALALTDHALQPVVLKRQSDERRRPR
jgi:hypothetical protein